MSEQVTQEELDKECDALIIQMNRDQKKNYLKFGAIVILVFGMAFTVLYTVSLIPEAVFSIMGQ